MNLTAKQEKLLITLLSFIQVTHILDFVIMMPLGPQLIRSLEISPTKFSWAVSAYTFSAAISGLLSSQFADRVSRKKILSICYLVFSVSTFLCGLAPNFYLLLVARCLAGASGGILNGIVFSIIADHIPDHRRGKALGQIMSSFAISSVMGIPLGLYIARHASWGTTFVLLGLISFLGFFLIKPIVPAVATVLSNQKSDENVFPKTTFYLGLMSAMLITIASFVVIPFISISIVANTQVLEADLYIIFLVAGAFTFFSSRFVGIAIDKLGQLRVFFTLAACSMFSTLLITRLKGQTLSQVVMVVIAFMVFNSGRYVPVVSLLLSRIPFAVRGKFMSMNSSLQSVASGVGSLIIGFFVSYDSNGHLQGYKVGGYMSIVFLVLCAVVLYLFNLRTLKHKETTN